MEIEDRERDHRAERRLAATILLVVLIGGCLGAIALSRLLGQ